MDWCCVNIKYNGFNIIFINKSFCIIITHPDSKDPQIDNEMIRYGA